MKLLRKPQRLALIGVLLLIQAFGGVLAGSPDAAPHPLPLPDLLFYGTTARQGELLESGTVKAVLARGAVVSAAIGPVSGTDYTYALAVPLSMYDPGETLFALDSAQVGEQIRFLIDDAPAVFKDQNGITVDAFTVPADAQGQTYVVNLALVGPGSFPLGDVNANGVRDAADAMRVLQYDVGLIGGDQSFPPAPGKIYLPLCDIVQDGQCNASDALRILQCDVGMPGVDCPANPGTLAAEASQPAAGAEIVFRAAAEAGPADDRVTVRVSADDPAGLLGAATLEVRYDPAQLAAESCQANPDGVLAGAACNAEYGPGVVRLNAVTTAGAGGEVALAEITFRGLAPGELRDPEAVAHALTLTADRVVLALGVAPVNDLVPLLQGKVPALYTIGDAEKPAKIHDAIAAGYDLGARL